MPGVAAGRRPTFSFPKKLKAMRPLEAHPSAGAGASSIGDGRRRVNLVLNIASRPWRRRVNIVPNLRSTRADADRPHNTQQYSAIRPETSSETRWHGGTSLPQQRHGWCNQSTATPTRVPKVGRLHLTSYGPTIICSSSTRRASSAAWST